MRQKIKHKRMVITVDKKMSDIAEEVSKSLSITQSEFIRRLIIDYDNRKKIIPEVTLIGGDISICSL